MRLSIAESNIIAEIYINKVLMEDNSSGNVGHAFGEVGSVGSVLGRGDFMSGLVNGDDYAPGDNRIPHILSGLETRRGKIKGNSKKGKTKNSKSKKLPFLSS